MDEFAGIELDPSPGRVKVIGVQERSLNLARHATGAVILDLCGTLKATPQSLCGSVASSPAVGFLASTADASAMGGPGGERSSRTLTRSCTVLDESELDAGTLRRTDHPCHSFAVPESVARPHWQPDHDGILLGVADCRQASANQAL